MATLDEEVKQIAARVAATQAKLGTLGKLDPAREAVKAEMAELLSSLTSRKAEAKRLAVLRSFAGLGNTPFFIAASERLDASTLAELADRAIELQTEREQIAAARRASKTAAAPVPTSETSKPATRERRAPAPEIILRRPSANGSAR